MKVNFFEISFCMFVLLASANFCRVSQSNGHGDSSSYANQKNRVSLSDSGLGSQNNDRVGSQPCACKSGHTRKGARALLFQLRLSGGCTDIDLITHENVAEHVVGKDDADIESAMSDVSVLPPDEAQRGRSRRRTAFDTNALNVADPCTSSDSSPLPKRSPRLAEKNSVRASCAGFSHASDISCSRSPSPNDAFDAPPFPSTQPASASPDRDERSQERWSLPPPACPPVPQAPPTAASADHPRARTRARREARAAAPTLGAPAGAPPHAAAAAAGSPGRRPSPRGPTTRSASAW